VLDLATLGLYNVARGTIGFYGTLWVGYQEDGFVGAINKFNPLTQIGILGAQISMAVEDDDYKAVGRAALKLGVMVAATIAGGKGALEKGAAGREAASGGGKLPRFQGRKPTYHVNEAHVPGSPRFNPKKEPLPADAAEVFKKAVPDAAEGANNWYGKNADGTIYRFSNANDDTAHFSGSSVSKDGIRNITPYARQRLEGK